MKYFAASFLLTFIASNVLNGLYYGFTADFHAFAMTKPKPRMDFLMINHAVFVGMMSYLYPHFLGSTTNYWKRGVWFGMCMGVIMFVPSAFVVRGAWEVPVTFFFSIDIVFHIVVSGILGVIIGVMHQKFSVT